MERPQAQEPRLIRSALALAGVLGAALLSACASSTASPDGPYRGDSPSERTAHAPMNQPTKYQASRSPVSLKDLELLQGSLLFGTADVKALRMSKPLVSEQAEAILDVWYGFVASTPQLVQYFGRADTGKPDAEYLAKVRLRCKQWILGTASANYDQEWLDYAHEIGLRHHSAKKNKTDGVDSVPIIHFRYLPALVYPVTATLRPFLEKGDHTPEEVEAMHQAWTKSVLLQAILWCHPYINEGEF